MSLQEFEPDFYATTVGKHACSREEVERLSAELAGYQAELQGHARDGHTRRHLGRSFGRTEGEIREDIDRVSQQLVDCNPEYH